MKEKMKPSERVMAVLNGEEPDFTPFTIYEILIKEEQRKSLYEKGLCIVNRVCSYEIKYNCKVEEYSEPAGENTQKVTRIYKTDAGDLRSVAMCRPDTSWTVEYLFKDESDYPKLISLIRSMYPQENYGAVLSLQNALNPDYNVIRDQIPLEPMQKVILEFMGTETFCYEWMDNRDEIMKLCEEIRKFNRKVYPIVARSPLAFCNYGGNVMPEVIGAKTFRELYIPDYLEAAEEVHRFGKKIGCHFDSNNSLILSDFQNTGLDYIEAYDLGMNPSLSEFAKVCDKTVWLNFPSAWQVHSLKDIYRETAEILADARNVSALIVGITEDVDEKRIVENSEQILKAISEVKRR